MMKRAMALAVAWSALGLGCGDEPGRTGDGPGRDATAETQEIVDNLVAAGFPADDVMVVDGAVYVGRDAVVSLQASREMLEVDASTGVKEQFRTNNLVAGSVQTICVDGTAFGSEPFNRGLNNAIDNYNQLNLVFRMKRITLPNTSGCNAVIKGVLIPGSGGVAGFPANGLPFNEIRIGVENAPLGLGVTEHVITHELGHAVGLRHSDFFNRSISCGTGGNEGDGGVGAILIPGTPSGATVGGSLMNSCFRANETGNFTSSDVTALQTVY